MVVRIKICGHTRVEDIMLSSKLGAHAVGVIYNIANSKRSNDIENTKKLFENVPIFVNKVLVTKYENLKDINKIKFDTIQLICDPKILSKVKEEYYNYDIMPVLYIKDKMPDQKILKIYSEFKAFVLDTKFENSFGGSGKTHDWNISRKLSKEYGNVILAGGLNEQNIAEAIRIVEPYGVDVSSGVESQIGIKDPNKVRNFIKRVMEIG